MREIPVYKRGEVVAFTTVDDEDADGVNRYRWGIDNWGCVRRGRRRNGVFTTVFLHREIAKLAGFEIDGLEVDHADGNRLNNCRKNLRPASRAQNGRNIGLNRANSSGFKGVYFNKKSRKWRAQSTVDNRRYNLGGYASKEQAARAYDVFAAVHHGEFAYFNFPDEIAALAKMLR